MQNPAPNLGDPAHQRRFIRAVKPIRHARHVLDQLGDVVGQEIDRAYQEMATPHGRVEHLEPQHRFRRVQAREHRHTIGLRAAISRKLLRPRLERT